MQEAATGTAALVCRAPSGCTEWKALACMQELLAMLHVWACAIRAAWLVSASRCRQQHCIVLCAGSSV